MINRNDFIFSHNELILYLQKKGMDIKKANIEKVHHPFMMMVPKYYLDLINWNDRSDPLRKMIITSSLENDTKEYERIDPIGDKKYEPVPGIVHRYKNRCLLMLTNMCAVHCRFCFRKSLLNSNTYDFKKCLDYIKKHKEIEEVIFSGGDPFMLTDSFLEDVIKALKQIKHIKLIRFHTRTPVVYPKRVTSRFVKILSLGKPIVIVFHINHKREITPEFMKSVLRLKKTEALLLSQSVILKGVNNNSETLMELFRGLCEIGIKPYYLHHLDYAKGTHYFRISVEEGKRIYRQIREKLSGYMIPEYVIDIPGGLDKVPVLLFKSKTKGQYILENYFNKSVIYNDPSSR